MADGNSNKWMPTAGGVLNIISGIFGFIGSFFLAFIAVVVNRAVAAGIIEDYPRLAELPAAFFWFLAFILFVLSLITLLGGVLAVQRKAWGLALAGSICAILHSNILGIIATVFVAMSRSEFKS
jgi:hypothetical protein